MLRKIAAYQQLYFCSNENVKSKRLLFAMIVAVIVFSDAFYTLPQAFLRVGTIIFLVQMFYHDKNVRLILLTPVSKRFEIINAYLFGITFLICLYIAFLGIAFCIFILVFLTDLFYGNELHTIFTSDSTQTVIKSLPEIITVFFTTAAVYVSGVSLMICIKRYRMVVFAIFMFACLMLGSWMTAEYQGGFVGILVISLAVIMISPLLSIWFSNRKERKIE